MTQTDEKIRNEEIRGQNNCETAAQEVGQKVRATIEEISGVLPEKLPPAENIAEVRKTLRGTHRQLASEDRKRLIQSKPKPTKKSK
jgi:DNA-damage-inducible protein D